MRTLRCIPIAGVFLAAGCSLPSRDNLRDPQNRPVAILNAVTVEGGRATPFELDASQSYDPRNPGAVLHFHWELSDPIADADLGTDELDDFDDVPGDSGHIFQTFPRAFVGDSNGEGILVRHVRVRVETDGGSTSDAEATIVVRNRRPIVDPGEDLFLSTTRTATVVLDAHGGGFDPTSIDPEGDPLYFTWTQLSGAAVVLDTAIDPVFHRLISFVPPLTKGSLTFRVDGTDGMSAETGLLRVHRAKQVWIASRAPTRLYRIFPDFLSKTSLEAVGAPGVPINFTGMNVVAVTSSGNVWTAEPSGADTLVRQLDPALRQIATWTVPGYATPSWAAAEGEDLCLVVVKTVAPQNPNRAFVRVSSMGVVSTPVGSDAIETWGTGSGDCWAVSRTKIEMLDPAGAVSPVASGFDVLNRATVALDGKLWASESDLNVAAKRIVRVSDLGLVEDMHLFDPPLVNGQGTFITDLVARRTGGIFFHTGLRQLSALSETGVVALTDAPPLRLDVNAARQQLVSDLSDGTLWFADSQSGDLVHLIDAGDTVRELGRTPIEALAPSAPLFLTPAIANDGSLLATAVGIDSWLFRIPTHMNANQRVNADLHATVESVLAVDQARGAAWIADNATTDQRLLRTSAEGRFLVNTGPTNVLRIVSTADTGAWTLSISGQTLLYRISMVSSTGATLNSAFSTGQEGFLDLDAAEDDACAIIQADRAALHPGDSVTEAVRLARGSSLIDVAFTLPAGAEGLTRCYVDRSDRALWLVSVDADCIDTGSGTTTLRRFAFGQTSPSLTLTGIGAGPFACSGATPDPVGGIWMISGAGLARIGASGDTGETLGAVGRVFPCGNGDPACREVWRLGLQGKELDKYDASGTLVGRYSAATAGQITAFDVVP